MTMLRGSRLLLVLLSAFVLVAQLVRAAATVASGQCAAATAQVMQKCLDQLESDEAKLPGGPCSSLDWRCICTKQQGFVDCYAPCPDQMSEDTRNFNRDNCAGQHDGTKIAGLGGTLKYTWSNLDDILQGAPVSNNGGDAPEATTTSVSAMSPSSPATISDAAPLFTGAPSNVSKTTSSHVIDATTTGASSSAAAPVLVAGFHVALLTIISLVLILATAVLL